MNNVIEEKKEEKEIKNVREKNNNNNKFSKFNLFNWGWFKFSKCTVGLFIYSLAINLFIVPNNLYTGGTLGMSQLNVSRKCEK